MWLEGIALCLFLISLTFFLISYVSGWRALAGNFGTKEFPKTNLFHGESLQMGSTFYCLIVTIGVTPEGLYLKVFPPLLSGHPKILLPWQEIYVGGQETSLRLGRLSRSLHGLSGTKVMIGSPARATLHFTSEILKEIRRRSPRSLLL